jgi:Helix-turn-helix domain
MEQSTSNLIPIPEAARRANVARNTMLLAAKNGKIKAVKLGRGWFVDVNDIVRWKQENYQPGRAYRFPVKPDDDRENSSSDE